MVKSAPNILLEKIERFVRKFYFNRLIQGVLAGAMLWIVFYLLINGLEYFSWFPSKGRFVLFLFLMAGSAFVAVFHFLIPLFNMIRFRKKMSPAQAAILIGRFFPDIQDKLLNTIQLTETLQGDRDNELLAATITQRTANLSPIRFSDAVDLRSNLKYLAIFFGMLAILLCLMIFFPNFALSPTQRIVNYEQHFEKPLPYQVVLDQTEIETTQGTDIQFGITVTGERIPDLFFVKSNQGQQLMQKTATNTFVYTFRNLYNDLEFNVIGGDYKSPSIRITVHPNPVLLSYSCDLHYPKYLHREDETLEGKTRLRVPQGTKLDFRFLTRNASEAFILSDSIQIQVQLADHKASYSFLATASTQFDVQVTNAWNTQVEPLGFSVEVLPDAYPDIRVESFDELLSSDLYFSGLVADDYGFTKLTFNCIINNLKENTIVKPVTFDLSQTHTSFFYHFNMDSLGILPGHDFEVFFEIWDNDGFIGPKSKRSETFTYSKPSLAALDSVADKTAENIMEQLAQKSKEAEKLQDDIEKMLQNLIQKKDLDWSDKEKMQELVKKQSEIQEEWNKLQKDQEDLKDFMEKNQVVNEDLLKKQEQINKLFDEVIPKEMQKMMEELQKMLDEMPREQMQQLMQDIKKNNQSMQELLDRNLALLEQLKMEKDLTDLADKLNRLGEELKGSENHDDSETSKSAEDAKKDFENLMDEFDKLLEKNKEIQQPFDMQKDEDLEDSINQDLEDANQNEQDGDMQQSKQQKQQAGEKMQQMANNMMMQMQSAGMEQMAEDAHLIRVLLENVVHASHQQESLLTEIGLLRSDDPSLVEKIILQKEIADNFIMVRDSLRSMALRQPAIQNFIFDALHTIDDQTIQAMQYLNNLKISTAVSKQQTAMMSMNNLALMLAESLDQMENEIESAGMPMSSNQPKPGKSQSMQKMQQMQQQLGEQLKQMQQQMQNQGQQNNNSMSEQFARMAAEQEMLRQGMQQMLQEMKENGQIGDDGLNQIIQDMEKLEEDLVNKKITRQTLQRNQEILSRMLESQKAQEKRDQDEQRKSNEFKGSPFDRKIDEYLYEQTIKRNQEFLKKNPIEYAPFYKDKINEYYIRKNSH